MNNTTKKIILVLALVAILAPLQASHEGAEEEIQIAEAVPEKPSETIRAWTEEEEWLERLVMCESSGNPEAINEEDLDGTPSYGLLQFKPSTFWMFAEAYGIVHRQYEPDTAYMPDMSIGSWYDVMMAPEYQRAIVRRMMRDPSVKWENQFPGCVRKLGLPPQPEAFER